MKNKGFTLIELLAVIIILAIIALIAVPSVLNLIEKSRDKATQVSSEGYIGGVNNCIMSKALIGEKITTNKVSELNTLCSEYLKGNLPTGGSVKIEDGIVTEYSLVFGDKTVNQNGDFESAYAVGKPVYFNPVDGEICEDYVAANSLNNNKTGCMQWYIIGEDTDTVDMILDHNTTDYVFWNNSGSNSSGPGIGSSGGSYQHLLYQLKNDTSGWTGVTTRTDSYTDPANSYTINYNGYKARLIEANEVAKITGADKALQWDSAKTVKGISPTIGTTIANYYLDGKYGTSSTWQTQVATSQGASKYAWLFDYTKNCTSKGCNIEDFFGSFGYWTSSAVSGYSRRAWSVICYGKVIDSNVDSSSHGGVRPVITIPKP